MKTRYKSKMTAVVLTALTSMSTQPGTPTRAMAHQPFNFLASPISH